jgi:hypothetical protein
MNQTETTTTNATEVAAKLTQVVSIAPAKLEDHQHVISWSRRSTDKNPVKTEERYRGIVVPAALLALPDGCTTSKFSALLQATIHDLADKKFASWAKDNMMVTQVDASQFSLDAVIIYWAEEKKAAQVDAAKITEWLKTSKTYAALPEQVQKVWLAKIPKIAAPSYALAFSKAQAATIVSKLHADDLDSTVAQFIATRCNNIITKESQEEAL